MCLLTRLPFWLSLTKKTNITYAQQGFGNVLSQLICSSYVLLETIALIQRRFGIEALRECHEKVFPLIQVIWIDETDHQSGMSTVLESERRKLSLVDATSFAVMHKYKIHQTFCFDPHFTEQGFVILK